jgi:hypothetical protein
MQMQHQNTDFPATGKIVKGFLKMKHCEFPLKLRHSVVEKRFLLHKEKDILEFLVTIRQGEASSHTWFYSFVLFFLLAYPPSSDILRVELCSTSVGDFSLVELFAGEESFAEDEEGIVAVTILLQRVLAADDGLCVVPLGEGFQGGTEEGALLGGGSGIRHGRRCHGGVTTVEGGFLHVHITKKLLNQIFITLVKRAVRN